MSGLGITEIVKKSGLVSGMMVTSGAMLLACGNTEQLETSSQQMASMDCSQIPEYASVPFAYPAGYLVQAEDAVYECLYNGGWCGQDVYAPPSGWAWSFAWRQVGTCDGGTTPDPDPCQGQPDGTSCNDGDMCTQGDMCVSGVCTPGLVSSCDPSCSAFSDCTGLSCGETNACGQACGSTCDAGCPDANTPACQPTCGDTPAYRPGAGYVVGDEVESNGQIYECLVRGWCDQTAYAPGTGWAWENAWQLVGDCS